MDNYTVIHCKALIKVTQSITLLVAGFTGLYEVLRTRYSLVYEFLAN